MTNYLRGVRSLLSVASIGLLFVLGSLVLRLYVIPARWLFPRQRFRLVSAYMKGISHGITGLLTLGGARFRRHGTLPTEQPVLVVANHQALLDILQVTLLAQPRVPAFVTRKRYARFVPLVSASIRMAGCPVVDPKRDSRGAVDAIREGARTLPHGMVIFAEGHRTKDGAIRPFRVSGIQAALEERRVPVYLVLNEGSWRVRRFVDLLFRVHLIDAVSEVMGPFEPPEHPAEIPRFVESLRERLVQRLAERRGRASPPSAA